MAQSQCYTQHLCTKCPSAESKTMFQQESDFLMCVWLWCRVQEGWQRPCEGQQRPLRSHQRQAPPFIPQQPWQARQNAQQSSIWGAWPERQAGCARVQKGSS